jgi:hypothetical protein
VLENGIFEGNLRGKSKIEELLVEANRQLEKCGLREKKGRLYLRSRHFPAKPGDKLGEQ